MAPLIVDIRPTPQARRRRAGWLLGAVLLLLLWPLALSAGHKHHHAPGLPERDCTVCALLQTPALDSPSVSLVSAPTVPRPLALPASAPSADTFSHAPPSPRAPPAAS